MNGMEMEIATALSEAKRRQRRYGDWKEKKNNNIK